MREIFFRGKRLTDGKWVYGCLIFNYTKSAYHILTNFRYNEKSIENMELYEVKRSSVGQYTGYKIDNIKVFENDIAKVHLEIPYLPHQDKAIDDIGIVCFDTEDLRYYVVSNTGKKYALCYIKEIIGNIHDSPELLGGNEE